MKNNITSIRFSLFLFRLVMTPFKSEYSLDRKYQLSCSMQTLLGDRHFCKIVAHARQIECFKKEVDDPIQIVYCFVRLEAYQQRPQIKQYGFTPLSQ